MEGGGGGGGGGGGSGGDGVDRISLLPDDILHHIVLFIPKKEVPRTLILVSKRWLTLWFNSPFLCLKPSTRILSESLQADGFMSSVEKAIFCRDKSNIIENFALSISGRCCASRVNECISEVVRLRVRELDLELMDKSPKYLIKLPPPSVASYNSLTFLKIHCSNICSINFPVSFSFPSLITMDLNHVDLYSTFAAELFNCPKLDNLVLTRCLVGLDSMVTSYIHPVFDHSLSNINKASISFVMIDVSFALDIIRAISSNVKVLCFTYPWMENLLDELSLEHDFFLHLKDLTLGFNSLRKSFPIMAPLLGSSPNLESLRIANFKGSTQYQWTSAAHDLIPSRCRLSSRLKWIELDCIDPIDALLALVRYFLARVETLERMNLVMKPMEHNSNDQVAYDSTLHQELLALCASSEKIVLSSPAS